MADSAQLLKTVSGGGTGRTVEPLPEFPALPDDVKKRFPSLADWEKKLKDYEKQKALRGMK